MQTKVDAELLCKYKYRLRRELWLKCGIRGVYARTEYIEIRDDGTLVLRKGYAWNGADGPTVDTESSKRGSAGHDALYQLISLGVLPPSARQQADLDLRTWCIEDGMLPFRADYWYEGVRAFGGLHV